VCVCVYVCVRACVWRLGRGGITVCVVGRVCGELVYCNGTIRFLVGQRKQFVFLHSRLNTRIYCVATLKFVSSNLKKLFSVISFLSIFKIFQFIYKH
jgi:hypothetical protein